MGEARIKRQQQEKYLQSNEVWKDVNNIAAHCRLMLVQYAQLPALLKNKTLLACVVDHTALANHINIFTRDLRSMAEQLDELDSTSSEERKKTGSSDPMEVVAAIELSEKYVNFLQLHEGVVAPNYTAILDIIRVAEHRMLEVGKAAGNEAGALEIQQEIRHDMQTARQTLAANLAMTPTTLSAEGGLSIEPDAPPAIIGQAEESVAETAATE
jgi:hypothetical protein